MKRIEKLKDKQALGKLGIKPTYAGHIQRAFDAFKERVGRKLPD